MNNIQYMLQIVMVHGCTTVSFETKEEALKLKKALLDAKNNTARKGELFTYTKNDNEISIYVSNIVSIVINSVEEYFDERYFYMYNERIMQNDIEENAFVDKFSKGLPKSKNIVKINEYLVELVSTNLDKSAKLNNVVTSFLNIANIIADSELDLGVRTQVVNELSSIQDILVGIDQNDNELIEKMLKEFQNNEGQNV